MINDKYIPRRQRMDNRAIVQRQQTAVGLDIQRQPGHLFRLYAPAEHIETLLPGGEQGISGNQPIPGIHPPQQIVDQVSPMERPIHRAFQIRRPVLKRRMPKISADIDADAQRGAKRRIIAPDRLWQDAADFPAADLHIVRPLDANINTAKPVRQIIDA